MQAVKVLILDACDQGICDHFASFERWLSACLDSVTLAPYSEEQLDGVPADFVVAHASSPASLESMRIRLERAFPNARRFAIAHAAPGRSECIPNAVVEAVCEALAG